MAAQYSPGAYGNNPMARGYSAPVLAATPTTISPKWFNSLMGVINGAGQAIQAPRNALLGNYPVTADPRTGDIDPYSAMIPDAVNLAGLVTMGAGAAPAEADALNMGIRAYHGSPHDFDKFDMSKIGTGEGNQAYGHGLYFAGNEGVAEGYRDALSDMPGNGKMYAVDINADPARLLDWDKSLSEQPTPVKDALQKAFPQYFTPSVINKYTGMPVEFPKPMTPEALATYAKQMDFPIAIPAENMSAKTLMERHNFDPAQMAMEMKRAGINGVQYLDAGSRAEGTGTRNYVIFDDSLINILKKYGIAAPIAGGAAAASVQQGNQLTAPAPPSAAVNPLLRQIGT